MTQPPASNPIPSVVNVASLNLRDAPTTAAAILAVMPKGLHVTVYAEPTTYADGYAWLAVDTATGSGYAVQYLNGVDCFLPASAPAPSGFRLKNPVGCAHVISSKFGVPRDYDGDGVFDDIHEGVDITHAHADCNPVIRSGADGEVIDVSTIGDYGNHIKIQTVVGAQTYVCWYCHLASMNVVKGQHVAALETIGVMGSTGNSTGLHLHLNVQLLGAPTPKGSPVASVIDPFPLIDW